MTAIVYGLEKEYGDRVSVRIENATKPEIATRIRNEYGFRSHGLVISDENGVLIEKLDGHELKEAQIRGALERTLNAP